MMKSARLTMLLILLSLTAVRAQQKQVQIEQMMKRTGIPGLSLFYIKNGKVNEIYHLGLRSNDTKLPVDSETVFKPLGMQRTSYVWQKAFDNDYAIPHIDIGLTDSRYFPANTNSAASLQTTGIDYSKFLMALLNKQGLKGSTFKMLFQPQSNSQL